MGRMKELWAAGKMQCDCGTILNPSSMKRHLASRKHFRKVVLEEFGHILLIVEKARKDQLERKLETQNLGPEKKE